MIIITPVTEKAKKWVNKHVNIESWQWLGDGFAVDNRYAQDLLSGMKRSHLKLDTDYVVLHG